MFNLRLEDYSIKELEELFGLVGIQYGENTLKQSYLRVVNKVNQTPLSQDFSSQTKKNTLLFLERVYNNLNKELNVKIKQFPQDNMSTITHNSHPVINNSTQSLPIPPKISETMPAVANTTKIVSFDSRFRDDINDNTNNYMLTLSENLKNVQTLTINSIYIPGSIKHISQNIGNSHFFLEIDNIRNLITLPDLIIHGFSDISLEKIFDFWKKVNTTIHNLGGQFQLLTILPADLMDYRNEIISGQISNIPLYNDFQTGNIIVHYNLSNLNPLQYPHTIILDFSKTIEDLEDPTDLRKKAGYALGFRKINYEFFNITNEIIITSESTIDYNVIKYGYLILDDFQSNGENNVCSNDITYSGCEKVAATSGKILAKIDYGKMSTGTIDDRLGGCTFMRNYLGKVNLNKFKISLIDEFGRHLDILNSDWSFNITIVQKKF
tara:strand:+ start:2656 stop:3966 length:1311 start_codon:yes stop_codon:yes gene_type:complete